MTTTYNRRQSVLLRGSFTDQNAAPVDPDTVELDIRDPSGATPRHTFPGGDGVISRSGVGVYQAIIPTPLTGRYYYAWYGVQGQLTPSDYGFFYVDDLSSGL